MWRLHFTPEDLTRVRLASSADPLWEIVHSLQIVATGYGEAVFGQWRRRVKAREPERWRALHRLTPPLGYFPDFLTPVGTTDLRDGIDAVMRTPKSVLSSQLERLGYQGPRAPIWFGELVAGEPTTLRGLGRLMSGYFEAILRPHWEVLRKQIDDELHRLGWAMVNGGVENLLASVSPFLRWESPTLTLVSKNMPRDVHLKGKGLLLVPSFFAFDDITISEVPDQPVVIVFPVRHQLGWYQSAQPGSDAKTLQSLLGRTRAQVLELLADQSFSTTELATQLDLSPASASKHAAVLRDAGLIGSNQQGKAVLHQASPLGVQLLHGTPGRITCGSAP